MSNNKLTQSEINNIVWGACDTFRGIIDPAQYKDYLLTTLFVKYLSDVHDEKKDELMERYKGDEKRVARALEISGFKLPSESHFQFLYENRNESNIGEFINIALTGIEDNNREKLEGVFRNIDFNSNNLGDTKERNQRLKTLLKDFSSEKLNLRPSNLEGNDVIGDAYEFLIENFASDAGKKAGEFYTPSGVSETVARLVEPVEGDRIYDPTCGSGSLLIKASNQVGSDNFSIYGQEVNGSTWALAKMNMFLHGINDALILWGDTIRNPLHLENDHLAHFNVVVANPPFSLDKWGADDVKEDMYNRFSRGLPPKSKGDWAFISHMIESTYKDSGRVGVVVPHGVLFRGASEGRIRKAVIDENLLETVVGLPANLFFGTGIHAAILIFNREKENTKITFIDASKNFESGKNQNKLRESDIKKIVDAAKAGKNAKEGILVEKYAYVATNNEIVKNDYNLNIPRYVDTFEEEEEVNIELLQKEIEKLEGNLTIVQAEMKNYLKELSYAK